MSDIRIYCLTLPGSKRHKAMYEKLEELSLPYEFVYGFVPDANQLEWEAIKDVQIQDLHNPGMLGIAGCRLGHIKQVEKALQDGQEQVVLCEDDIIFLPGFTAYLKDMITKLHAYDVVNIGHIGISYWFPYIDVKNQPQTIEAPVWASDQCYLLNRQGLQFYLEGLKSCSCPSDVGMTNYCRLHGKNILSVMPAHTKIRPDENFHMNSTIWKGPEY